MFLKVRVVHICVGVCVRCDLAELSRRLYTLGRGKVPCAPGNFLRKGWVTADEPVVSRLSPKTTAGISRLNHSVFMSRLDPDV